MSALDVGIVAGSVDCATVTSLTTDFAFTALPTFGFVGRNVWHMMQANPRGLSLVQVQALQIQSSLVEAIFVDVRV
jgi:hypothetical protein